MLPPFLMKNEEVRMKKDRIDCRLPILHSYFLFFILISSFFPDVIHHLANCSNNRLRLIVGYHVPGPRDNDFFSTRR